MVKVTPSMQIIVDVSADRIGRRSLTERSRDVASNDAPVRS